MRIQALAFTAMLLTACGGGGSEVQTLTGAGATFPNPIYSKWFAEYRNISGGKVEVNYQPLGSGAGVSQITEGTVDFGASDMPMNDEQMATFRSRHIYGILHFPTVIGAVVPVYNLPGVTASINFTPEALAGIFLGQIKRWNDPAIASANAGLSLPNAEIVVVHRSDGSGTTYVWTDYLSKISPAWASGPGRNSSINWPVGLGGKGSEGVAGQVRQTANSLGYVEMTYAVQTKMSMGTVKNAAGNFVAAGLESVTAAADGVTMPDDFRVSITNPAGAQAYPIASFTWLLIPEKIEDAAKRTVIKEFLEWMLGPGQGMTGALDYAPLPAAVVAKEKQLLGTIQ